MLIIYVFFAGSALVTVMALYYWARILTGTPVRNAGGDPLPWWAWATLAGFGILGMLGSAPGIFLGQPDWFTDRIYGLVSQLIAGFNWRNPDQES